MKEQIFKKINICPYCDAKISSNEGCSEVNKSGLTKVQCPYCMRTYKIKPDTTYWRAMARVWGRNNIPQRYRRFLK